MSNFFKIWSEWEITNGKYRDKFQAGGGGGGRKNPSQS